MEISYSFLGNNSDFRITTEIGKMGVISSQLGLTLMGGESWVLSQLEKNSGKFMSMTGLTLNY